MTPPPKETCTLSLLEKGFPFSKDLQEDFYISIQIKRKRLQPQNFIKNRSITLKLPRRGVFAGCDVGALQLHAVLLSRRERDVVGLMFCEMQTMQKLRKISNVQYLEEGKLFSLPDEHLESSVHRKHRTVAHPYVQRVGVTLDYVTLVPD